MPWALPQGMRFVVFLGMAVAMSRMQRSDDQGGRLPALRRDLSCCIFVEALGFVGKGAQRWLDLGSSTSSRPS